PVEVRHREKHLTAERLEAAARIASAIAQNGSANTVGDARLNFLEPGVLAPDPLAGDKADAIAALLQRRDQIRQKRRIVLTIAIERRHDGAARSPDTASY